MSLNSLTLEQYLKDLASDKPAPGGGAAVAICAAQAVALLSMTMAVSGDIPDKLPANRWTELTMRLEKSRCRFIDLAERDAAAFAAVMTCYALPKKTEQEKTNRTAALQSAFKKATEIPFSTMELAAEILDNAKDVVNSGKPSVISDAAIGVDFLYTVLKACQHNVRINLKYIQDESFRKTAENRMDLLAEGREKQCQALIATIQDTINTK